MTRVADCTRPARSTPPSDHALFVDLSEVAVAPTLIVLADVEAIEPVERPVLRVLEALCQVHAQLVLYSRSPSADVTRLRVELPRASWLYPSSAVTPRELVTLLKNGIVGARVLLLGVRPDLRRALGGDDGALALDTEDVDLRRSILCSTLWAIVKLRYRVRETIAE